MARKNGRSQSRERISAGAQIRRALYLRVSTEDQAERGTIRAQLDFLRQRIELDNKGREIQGLDPIIVAGEYLDDGISGSTPLGDRPDGGRLLADARDGLFDSVLVYRLDRLGRRLRVLMDAHDSLEDAGCTVISASEPFDTSTPFGKAMFQFLGLMAELEKSTIADRMNSGRDVAVRGGRWTNGVIPFGFDVDPDGRLIVSDRVVAGTGMTESEIAYQIFDRMAHREGETLNGLCRWLNALGVPTESRYPNGRVWKTQATEWRANRIHAMIGRSVYSGERTFNSRLGEIAGAAPALVTPELQAAAIARLRGNAAVPTNGTRFNLLSGLLVCGECGLAYVGNNMKLRSGKRIAYYQCGGRTGKYQMEPGKRCQSKLVPAEEAEQYVRDYVRSIAENPGAEIEQAQAETRQKASQASQLEAQQETLVARLRDLAGERDRIMTLFKRGRATLEETEAQLDETASKLGAARSELESIRSQQELAEASEARLITASAAMAALAKDFHRVPPERQREIIKALIPQITVETIALPQQGKRTVKDYSLKATTIVGAQMTAPDSTVETHNGSDCMSFVRRLR
jgi:site-specific DNA recombinase